MALELGEAACLQVLEKLVGATGLPWDPAPVRSVLRREMCFAQRLEAAAETAGLELRPWAGDPAVLLAGVRQGLPVLALSEERGAIIVSASRRGPRGRWLGPNGWEDIEPEQIVVEDVLVLAVRPLAAGAALLGPARTEEGPIPSPEERLLALLREERQALGVVLVFAVGVGLLGLATPVTVQVLINTVAFGTLTQPIVVLTGLLALCLLAAAALKLYQRVAVEQLQRRLFVRVVSDLAWRLPRVKLSALDRSHGPELANRFFDVLTVQKAATSLLLDGLSAALQAVVGLLLLAVYHPALLGFDLVLLLSGLFVLGGLGRGATTTAVKESKAKYAVAAWIEQLSAPMAALRSASASAFARDRADDLSRSYLVSRKKHFRVFFRQLTGSLLLQVMANTALLGLGGWLVVERQLTLGQLVAAEIIVGSVLAGLNKFTDKLETYYDLLAALDKLGTLGALPLESTVTGLAPPAGGGARLEVREVTAGMAGGPDVLRGASVELKPGEKVAIIDGEGRGATVLAEVAVGLRQPRGGEVRLDGAPLDELDPLALRDVVVLAREREVIPCSLANNVLPGEGRARPNTVREVLDLVDLLPAVASLPDGLDTSLNPNGLPLSPPQVARLSLARALAVPGRVLVVDHLLDGLDPMSQQRLARMLSEREATLLLFTREPSVASSCDRILVLREGKLEPLTTKGGGGALPHFLASTVGEA